MLWATLQSRYRFFEAPGPLPIFTDFCLNVGGILFATTLYASHPALLLALVLAPCLLISFSPRANERVQQRPRTSAQNGRPGRAEDGAQDELSEFPIRPFLTAYRGAMMIVTCHAILAVDFHVFPRRFAKVETWGTSVMDMGVGSFVFSAGVISAKSHTTSLKGKPAVQKSFNGNLIGALRHSLPLLGLGIVRLMSVKNLDYAEHVSEYGVHWNFFFTLALLPMASAFLQPLISALPGPSYAVVGLSIATLFEIILQRTGLKAWALTARRDSLLSQNKEGVVSSIGYLAIFLLGVDTGSYLLPRYSPYPSSTLVSLLRWGRFHESKAQSARIHLLTLLARNAFLYSILLLPFFYPSLFPSLSIPISRRLANAPYILWVASFNTTQILLFALIESLTFPKAHLATNADAEQREVAFATSHVLADFNAGGLLLFLAANLGTGAVNMSMKTLDVPNIPAVVLLILYMASLTVVARLLRRRKIKFRIDFR